MKRLGILWLAGVIFLPMTSGARLDEARKQIETRDGKPERFSTSELCFYSTNGIQIDGGYTNGVSVIEAYQRQDRDFEPEEFDHLLAINAATGTWKQTGPDTPGFYQRSDRGTVAFWLAGSKRRIVIRSDICPSPISEEMRKKIDADNHAEKTRDIQGF